GCCGAPVRLPAATPATWRVGPTIRPCKAPFACIPTTPATAWGRADARTRGSGPGRRICWADLRAGRSIDTNGDHGSRHPAGGPRHARGESRRQADAGHARRAAPHQLLAERPVGGRPLRSDGADPVVDDPLLVAAAVDLPLDGPHIRPVRLIDARG